MTDPGCKGYNSDREDNSGLTSATHIAPLTPSPPRKRFKPGYEGSPIQSLTDPEERASQSSTAGRTSDTTLVPSDGQEEDQWSGHRDGAPGPSMISWAPLVVPQGSQYCGRLAHVQLLSADYAVAIQVNGWVHFYLLEGNASLRPVWSDHGLTDLGADAEATATLVHATVGLLSESERSIILVSLGRLDHDHRRPTGPMSRTLAYILQDGVFKRLPDPPFAASSGIIACNDQWVVFSHNQGKADLHVRRRQDGEYRALLSDARGPTHWWGAFVSESLFIVNNETGTMEAWELASLQRTCEGRVPSDRWWLLPDTPLNVSFRAGGSYVDCALIYASKVEGYVLTYNAAASHKAGAMVQSMAIDEDESMTTDDDNEMEEVPSDGGDSDLLQLNHRYTASPLTPSGFWAKKTDEDRFWDDSLANEPTEKSEYISVASLSDARNILFFLVLSSDFSKPWELWACPIDCSTKRSDLIRYARGDMTLVVVGDPTDDLLRYSDILSVYGRTAIVGARESATWTHLSLADPESVVPTGTPRLSVSERTTREVTVKEIKDTVPEVLDLPAGEPLPAHIVNELVALDVPVDVKDLPGDTFPHPVNRITLKAFRHVRRVLRDCFGVSPHCRLVAMRKLAGMRSWVVVLNYGDGPQFLRVDTIEDDVDNRLHYAIPQPLCDSWQECFSIGPPRYQHGLERFTLNIPVLAAMEAREVDEETLRQMTAKASDDSLASAEARNIWTRLGCGHAWVVG